MIGLDANVLVRLLTADETIQLKAATQLLTGFEGQANSFYINDMVLVELVWVLRRLYGFDAVRYSIIADQRCFCIRRPRTIKPGHTFVQRTSA